MTSEKFLSALQSHTEKFASAVADHEGAWLVKGFIDLHKRVYTISIDTKLVSKVLELLLFPMFVDFAQSQGFEIELSPQQNFYPDLTFKEASSGMMFAVDIKSTYRKSSTDANGMTLGAFTGYFRNRDSSKNTLYPYARYSGHFVLGVLYSQSGESVDERKVYRLDELSQIPSVIRDFTFFAQPKFRIATARPGSGNTKNIGSVTKIIDLVNGTGPFSILGEEAYDDYWMFYLTRDMAEGGSRPYFNLKSYTEYKKRGLETLTAEAVSEAVAAENEQDIIGEDAE